MFLCLIAQSFVAFAGEGDPKPLTKEEAELAKKKLDEAAQGDKNKVGVILQAQEADTYFVITAGAARFAETISNLVDDAGTDLPMPLPNITRKALATVAAYLQRLQVQSNAWKSMRIRSAVGGTIR